MNSRNNLSYFKFIVFIGFIFFISCRLFAFKNLEKEIDDFIIEIKKIEIEEHPYAFNASIAKWQSSLVICFREIHDIDDSKKDPINSSGFSSLGIGYLNEDFSLKGNIQYLKIPCPHFSRAEDPRLIVINQRLYVIYSDNVEEEATEGGFRVFVAEIVEQDDSFAIQSVEKLSDFPGELSTRREKNWVPFNYQDSLLLGYSLKPHRILYPLLDGSEKCMDVSTTLTNVQWEWGEMRGGTPALKVDNEYIAFFHSSIYLATEHSKGVNMPHYFIGVYSFQSHPPFAITKISPKPLIGKNFYDGVDYEYYWKPVRVVFPCGFIQDKNFFWVTYGRQDHEIWVVKIDKKKLMGWLVPVDAIQK